MALIVLGFLVLLGGGGRRHHRMVCCDCFISINNCFPSVRYPGSPHKSAVVTHDIQIQLALFYSSAIKAHLA